MPDPITPMNEEEIVSEFEELLPDTWWNWNGYQKEKWLRSALRSYALHVIEAGRPGKVLLLCGHEPNTYEHESKASCNRNECQDFALCENLGDQSDIGYNAAIDEYAFRMRKLIE